MTGPPIDPTAPAVKTGAQWSAAQSAPRSAMLEQDPEKATTSGFGRALTGAEYSQSQRMTTDQVKQWKIPAFPKQVISSTSIPSVITGRGYDRSGEVPILLAPRDVTQMPADATTKGMRSAEWSAQIKNPIIGPIMRQLVDPVLEHPIASAPLLALAVPGVVTTLAAAGPVAAASLAASAVVMGGMVVHHIAQYGWQKLAESQLDPETRKIAEADPERISGESAAVQAIMLGLAPLVHVGARATDFSAGMIEAGIGGLKETNFAPRFSRGGVARSRFVGSLPQGAGLRGFEPTGADAKVPVELRVPKGFQPTAAAPASARGTKPVEGLIVPETAKPGRVTPIETEPASARAEAARLEVSRFDAMLEQGAQEAVPTRGRRPAGFEPTAAAPTRGRVEPVEGLVVPETAKPGRVKPIETESASAPLQERADVDAARRDYETRRATEDAQDIAAHRLADAERVLGLREPEPESMAPRRRPGGVKPAPFFETPTGAETLGATAARHGLPAEANPYHPKSPLAPDWEAGHQAATESYPLYPEGFSTGAAESRIPPGYKPSRVQGFEPTQLPEGVTPETAEFSASLRPSRFRGHSVKELAAEARSARETMERAQSRLDSALEYGEPVRDADGNLRRDLSLTTTDDLAAESARLAELNAGEEAAFRAVEESAYRANYNELPSAERTGRSSRTTDAFGNKIKRQAEDLPDADGTIDPERLAADNKTVAEYHRNAAVRAARQKAIDRIDAELATRNGDDTFEFGANAPEGGAAVPSGQAMLERSIARAKGILTQVEREFAMRGVSGDKLAELINSEAEAAAGVAEGTGAASRNAVHATRETQDLVNTLRTEGERRGLERAAKTDELTGLGNQRAFRDALDAAEADPNVSIIRFDANGFKAINDNLGHQAGDDVLAQIGRTIREQAKDLPVFRAGGDEFAVFAPRDRAAAIRDAIEEAVGVKSLGEPGDEISYSISGGVGETNAAADAAAILRKAEQKAAQGILGRDGQPVAPTTSEAMPGARVEGRGLTAVEGTGETRTRTLAAGVEQKALANHLELTVGDLPEYRTIKMADQAERASALLAEDPELAIRVATGDAPAPRGLLPESVFVAVEQRAIAEGDVSTLRDLATGRLTTEATTMGQRIRALGERDPESPVSAIQDIVKTRSGGAKNAERVSRATEAEVQAITKHVDALPIDVGAWESFLARLQC